MAKSIIEMIYGDEDSTKAIFGTVNPTLEQRAQYREKFIDFRVARE